MDGRTYLRRADESIRSKTPKGSKPQSGPIPEVLNLRGHSAQVLMGQGSEPRGSPCGCSHPRWIQMRPLGPRSGDAPPPSGDFTGPEGLGPARQAPRMEQLQPRIKRTMSATVIAF